MLSKHFIQYYTPCTEVQRKKIEALRNEKRLAKYVGLRAKPLRD